ncbi:MAG: hypothetical protein LBT00_13700 [Spirochaetaceae bacterium]|jgi:class 3 adenylate cyclase/HAMP domain-containing protein|nr:hypothetical protein [Spirochaetaceae bacterium]
MLLKNSVIMRLKKYGFPLGICGATFVLCVIIVVFNVTLLKKPLFQQKTDLVAPSVAKYEKDGNLYIVDDSGLRLISMTLDGRINYTITVNTAEEYTRFYDLAVDEMGNLYVYAMEVETDAYLTKRDTIRKYDRAGRFVKNILAIDYDENTEERPRFFPQFGSLRCDKAALTFSRTRRDRAQIYRYDIYRDTLTEKDFLHQGPHGGTSLQDFAVERVAVKDFDNFVYTTRDGDIYEVRDAGSPVLRASFNFTEDGGGIIPDFPLYDSRGTIVFIDVISSFLYYLDDAGAITGAVPEMFLEEVFTEEVPAQRTNYGLWEGRFSGIAGELVWYYDGSRFETFKEGLLLPLRERAAVMAVQICFALGIAALLLGLYLLFARMLDWYISLIIKQAVIIIPLTIIGFVVLYSVFSTFLLDSLNNEIMNELNFLAEYCSSLISGDDLDSIKSIKDSNGETYKRIARMLKDVVGENKRKWNKAFYASVIKVIDNEEFIVAMSNDEASLFRPEGFYITLDSKEYALVTEGKPFSSLFINYTGAWAYSNFPIYNSGGNFSGIFEIGLDLMAFNINNLKYRRFITFIIAVIVLVILAALILVMSFVINQLSKIARVFDAIALGEYFSRATYSAKDELGTVSLGLNQMANKLQQQIDYIKKMNESAIHFVPTQFLEYLGVTDITQMKLGDHVRRDLSVLFFDIRSFSLHSEVLSTQENFFFINKILSVAGPVLRKHNGFVDKFIGDAVMALFVDATDAVEAGIEVYRRVVLDRTTRIKVGIDGINIGIGIHTGSVMMGIVGEPERFSNTVISKNVNLASRVESLTKQTKSGMLITRDTLNQLADKENEFQHRFIGLIQAAGVNEVIGLFDMLDALPESVRKRRLATKRIFESGIRKYHIKEYRAAAIRFEAVVKADPSDVCAEICLSEAKKHLENPDLPSVFVFNKK